MKVNRDEWGKNRDPVASGGLARKRRALQHEPTHAGAESGNFLPDLLHLGFGFMYAVHDAE